MSTLTYERGGFCSWYDGEVVDLEVGDPHLRYVSVSDVKEPDLGAVDRALPGQSGSAAGNQRRHRCGNRVAGSQEAAPRERPSAWRGHIARFHPGQKSGPGCCR